MSCQKCGGEHSTMDCDDEIQRPSRMSQSSFAAPTGLDALRERLLARAVACSTCKQKAISDGHWHEAHEAEVRRGVWIEAAEMAQQQRASNDQAHPQPVAAVVERKEKHE